MSIPTLMGSMLLVSLIAFAGICLRRIFKLNLPLACLLGGLLGGVIIEAFHLDTGIRAANIKDLVFFIVLPLLIFSAAWRLNARIFRRWFVVCFFLATVVMIASISITASAVYYAIAHPTGFPWIAALLVATILSATDPVSVSAQLKTAGTSEDLQTIFEGESLLNDATVVVFFGVLLSYAQGYEPNHNPVIEFLVVFFGGITIGVLAGLLAAILTLFINDRSASVIILIFSAFGVFYLAEAIIHVSGIMAVTATAIIARVLLKDQHQNLLSDLGNTLNWLDLYLNSVIFSLMGLLFTFQMLTHQWLAIIIAIVTTVIARFIVLHAFAYVTRWTRKEISQRWALLLSWGGQKGLIAIALVLSLPIELDYWWTVQSMVFGVVLFSTVVQGESFPFLLRRILNHESTRKT